MKTKQLLIGILISGTALLSCKKKDNKPEPTPVSTTTNLTLNLSGLDDLGNDFVYEGWIIVNGSPVSTGTFTSITFPQTFTVNSSDLSIATKFVLSIEPKVDTDPSPSATKVLVGDFSGNTATLGSGTIGDFSNIGGKYILATPTNGAMTDENSGIWFLDLVGTTPMTGLTLPTLPSGWIYEGWAVINGTPVSTGTFTNLNATDNSSPFSGTDALGMPNGSDGFFPGEDFLLNAPSGLTFPTDLSGGKAVISIEPVPDNSPMPFTLKPLVGSIPTSAADHTTYDMTPNVASFPTGSVTR